MMLLLASSFAVVCAAIPAIMFLRNVTLFIVAERSGDEVVSGEPADLPQVSVLIPARNEADGIRAAIEAILAIKDVVVEVVILDDHSEDNTAEIVRECSALDSRLRLLTGSALPPSWNGKQYACYQLAKSSRYPRLLFLDADVRLADHAIADLVKYQDQQNAALLSGFPHQETGTWMEKWMIPIMHFILLGFLPFERMRQSREPAYAAGCGQLFMTRKSDYETAGTHAAIASSRHDGVKLPRAYRAAGLSTDCIDATSLASCRMYDSAATVTRGLLKNATEGIASPRLIVPFTIILLGGSLLPLVTMIIGLKRSDYLAITMSAIAIGCFHLPRVIAAIKFRQSTMGVWCHVPSIITFVGIQWLALVNHLMGRKTPWRGRIG